jgi:transcriptional regulator GlxA family with amidase domain
MKYIIYSLITIALFGCNAKVEADKSVDISTIEVPPVMPNKVLNVALLMVNGVYNSELVAPMDILHHTVFHTDKGMNVFTVAPTLDAITTFEGLRILPDYSYLNDSLPTIDVLVVPSAEHSMDTDLEDDALINFVKNTGENAQYVMSLCDGAFVLAKAGLIDGLESTTFPSDIAKYREMYPQLKVHEDVSFVHDGKAITSAGGAKSYDPALYLSELLYGKKVAKGIAGGLVIDWDVNNIKHVVIQK